MSLIPKHTIFALASAAGKAGVAVFRISGPDANSTIQRMTNLKCPLPKHLHLSQIVCPTQGTVIDTGMIVSFPAPHSFTGENVVEFHTHGSPAVIRRILEAFSRLPGLRLAERGEFTQRAFLNGKMTFAETESLADLIDAQTEVQRKVAISKMSGNMLSLFSKWALDITEALALVEAYIDFNEDAYIGNESLLQAKRSMKDLQKEIKTYADSSKKRSFIWDGFQTAIVGKVNAGKSSLINAITRKKVSIVSSQPGTTRDIVKSNVEIGGFPVVFCDTAGMRNRHEQIDAIEREGIELAEELIQKANVLFIVIDACEVLEGIKNNIPRKNQNEMDDFFRNSIFEDVILNGIVEIGTTTFTGDTNSSLHNCRYKNSSTNHFLIFNKIDKLNGDQLNLLKNMFNSRNCFFTSCKEDIGIDLLCDRLGEFINDISLADSSEWENSIVLNQRQLNHLNFVGENLLKFVEKNSVESELAISAEYLRMALENVGYLTGKIDNEKILGIIFERFCIGK